MDKFTETVKITIDQLCRTASDKSNNGYDIDSGIGEVIIGGVEYQIQISLKSDKKTWCSHNEIRMSEVVKIHE